MKHSRSTITCESCGAPLSLAPGKDYFVCSYCGAYYFPKAGKDGLTILGEPGTLICPVCMIPLVTAKLEEVRLEACPRCHGVMILQRHLAIIVQYLRLKSVKDLSVPPLEKADLQKERCCQTCGEKMDTHVYGGGGNVVIDVCPKCKVVWFDYEEINRVITAPDFRSG